MSQEKLIVACGQCGAKNRIPGEKIGEKARCGKCSADIDTTQATPKQPSEETARGNPYLVRCISCGARNRVPENKMGGIARCGKCREPIETQGLLSGKPVMIEDKDFETKVLKSPVPVLLFAFADWCPSCRSVAPAVEELARDWKGKARVAKANVDRSPAIANRFSIMSVPTMIFFDNGQARDRLTGAVPKLQIARKMAPFL